MSAEPRNPIQVVARAMLDSDIEQGHATVDSPWGRYEVLARVAIEAMQIPTKKMLAAGQKAGRLAHDIESGMVEDDLAECVWRDMCDEALR